MNKKIILTAVTVLLCASWLPAQEYGVLIMQTGSPAKKKTAASALPLPKDVKVDDNMLLNSKHSFIFRHEICAEGQYVAVYEYSSNSAKKQAAPNPPRRRLEGRTETKCAFYTGPNTPEAKKILTEQALKEFGFYTVFKSYVKESMPVNEGVLKFNLKNMQASAVSSFDTGAGIVYKLILADKNKIKKLYNYSYEQISVELEKIMKENKLDALPVRISVYESYNGALPPAGLAVFTFTGGLKFTVDIGDLNNTGAVYDIKPDFAVKYSPAQV